MNRRMRMGIVVFLFFFLAACEDDEVTFTVVFEPNGGNAVSDQEVQEGERLEEPETSKEGYTLDGWYTSPDDGVTLDLKWVFGSQVVRDDLTLYAKWTPNTHEVRFEGQGADGGDPLNRMVVTYDQPYGTLPVPTRTGHTFLGWSKDTGDDVFVDEDDVVDMTEDHMLIAVWQINRYTITFNSNEGSSVDPIIEDFGTDVTEPESPERPSYTFAGCFSDEDLTIPYVFETMPAEDITLYALWHNTITFDSNEGSSVDPIMMRAGEEIEEPETPTKEGYNFIAWFTDEAFTEAFVFSTMPEPSVTLYAKWARELTELVQIGVQNTTYTIPTGTGNNTTTTVPGGYLMATTETTYELWYEVRIWAESNGYVFQNQGREGHDGTIGALPTDNEREPVTTVSWRDVVVWLNAASEMSGFDPVYRTSS